MESTLDRRDERSERVPLHIAVELGEGDFRDAFAGQARNLSKGGISMRAACLPDVGSRLVCRFRSVPSGTPITAQGEVVWAHLDGERSGEFGLAFVDLDPNTEWLIEEMIAEHVAHAGRALDPLDDAGPEVATLELDGSPQAIEARVRSAGPDRAVFEQELELLRLGRGVRALAGEGGREGSISKVELRMVGSVPMLAVTVAFEDARAPGRGALEPSVEPALVHDTEPDLRAPEPLQETGPEPSYEAAVMLEPGRGPEAAPAPEAQAALQAARRETSKPVPLDRDFSTSFALPPRDAELDLDPSLDFEAMATPAWKSALERSSTWAREGLRVLLDEAHAHLLLARRAASPRVRGAWLRAAAVVRSLHGEHIGPQLGALRRFLAAQLGLRKRRKTASPGSARAARGSFGRTLLLGLLGASATALAVYALVPTTSSGIDLHRPVQAAVAAPPADAPAPAPRAALPAVAAVQDQAPQQQAQKPDPARLPSAERVPAGSPFAVDVRARPQAPAEAKPASKPGALRFGADKVPNARRFTLRMSNEVKSMEGTADDGGFMVKLFGTLSLDRAGPISSAHRAVQRSMVINRGDRAELTIRFADGKRPAYQVKAEGRLVHVLIEER